MNFEGPIPHTLTNDATIVLSQKYQINGHINYKFPMFEMPLNPKRHFKAYQGKRVNPPYRPLISQVKLFLDNVPGSFADVSRAYFHLELNAVFAIELVLACIVTLYPILYHSLQKTT